MEIYKILLDLIKTNKELFPKMDAEINSEVEVSDMITFYYTDKHWKQFRDEMNNLRYMYLQDRKDDIPRAIECLKQFNDIEPIEKLTLLYNS